MDEFERGLAFLRKKVEAKRAEIHRDGLKESVRQTGESAAQTGKEFLNDAARELKKLGAELERKLEEL